MRYTVIFEFPDGFVPSVGTNDTWLGGRPIEVQFENVLEYIEKDTVKIDAMKEMLEELAKRHCWDDDDDFNPMDQSEGFYDDTYYRGQEDGKTILVRNLLSEFFKG